MYVLQVGDNQMRTADASYPNARSIEYHSELFQTLILSLAVLIIVNLLYYKEYEKYHRPLLHSI